MTVYVDEGQRVKTNEAARRYRARHLERVRAHDRERYRKDPERAMNRTRRWRAKLEKDPNRREERRVKDNAMARKAHSVRRLRKDHEGSGGRPRPDVCDLCGKGGKIYFDHCHDSGEFRGWLCIHCNLALGHVRDNPSLLRKLANYLEAA